MPSHSSAEAYDWIRFSRILRKRLLKARASLLKQGRRRAEARWLADGAKLLEAAYLEAKIHLGPARELPELEVARGDHARMLREAWVRRLEKLVETISEQASPRSPMIETLFPHRKWKELYRAKPEPLRRYQLEFERRATLGYVKRMLGTAEFAFLAGPLERTRAAFQKWEKALEPPPLSEEQAERIRFGLISAFLDVEKAVHRAKLLAQAALAPEPGAFETFGLNMRPKRRGAKRRSDPAPLAATDVEPPAPPEDP
jgi:hypothetical protein